MPISPDRLTSAIGALLPVLRLPTSTATKVIQWSSVAVAFLLLITDVLSPKWKVVAVTATAALQAVQAALAHRANPDGTPAQAPWEPGGAPGRRYSLVDYSRKPEDK
jgi:hypothetical protein